MTSIRSAAVSTADFLWVTVEDNAKTKGGVPHAAAKKSGMATKSTKNHKKKDSSQIRRPDPSDLRSVFLFVVFRVFCGHSFRLSVGVIQLAVEPGLGVGPVAVGGGPRQAQRLGRLLVREA